MSLAAQEILVRSLTAFSSRRLAVGATAAVALGALGVGWPDVDAKKRKPKVENPLGRSRRAAT